jgi:hypothetical protein
MESGHVVKSAQTGGPEAQGSRDVQQIDGQDVLYLPKQNTAALPDLMASSRAGHFIPQMCDSGSP